MKNKNPVEGKIGEYLDYADAKELQQTPVPDAAAFHARVDAVHDAVWAEAGL